MKQLNKKGQLTGALVTFVVLVLGLIIIAPFVLKVFNSFVTPFGSAIGNVTTEAGEAVSHITGTFVGFWDFVLVFAFLVNVILLLITSFLVDTHPAWLVVYIVFALLLLIFAPEALRVMEVIYDSPQFALEVSQLAMMDFIREFFGLILVGIYFITGIIIYSKFKFAKKGI